MMFPYNLNNKHWILVTLDARNHIMNVYDSLVSSNKDTYREKFRVCYFIITTRLSAQPLTLYPELFHLLEHFV